VLDKQSECSGKENASDSSRKRESNQKVTPL
jgi:hypothetical protein